MMVLSHMYIFILQLVFFPTKHNIKATFSSKCLKTCFVLLNEGIEFHSVPFIQPCPLLVDIYTLFLLSHVAIVDVLVGMYAEQIPGCESAGSGGRPEPCWVGAKLLSQRATPLTLQACLSVTSLGVPAWEPRLHSPPPAREGACL